MKIAYVGNFDKLSVGEPEIAKSLEELGHQVFYLDERFATIEEVKKTIEMEKCDIFLFAKFRVGNPKERWEFLKELKVPKVCWVFDLFWGL